MIVRGYWPTGTALVAVSVSVLFVPVGFGEKDAVTPLGRPEMERLTLPLNPYCEFTKTYAGVEVPWPKVTLPGP